MLKLLVVKLNRPHILIPAMDRLHLALAPQATRHLRSRHSHHQQDDEDGHNQPHQHEPLLALAMRTMHNTHQLQCPINGRVCRLLLAISSTKTELAEIVTILYRR
jgi:hypothetical protein